MLTAPRMRTKANAPSSSVHETTVSAPRASAPRPALDPQSQAWIDRLSPGSRERDAAIEELHALLLKGARFEVRRRAAAFTQLRGGDHDDLAHQSADDALVAILGKLDEFRGDSRFTTWAYKFALFEAGVKVRRRAWQGREVPLEPETWTLLPGGGSGPEQDAETKELFGALRDAIASELSPHQRETLVAVTLNDVPIDVLAERLNTSRGALYKTIHDARHNLRAALAERGLGFEETEGRQR
jgi:RNA polymerase sigma-70 factor (ECF subfamily)